MTFIQEWQQRWRSTPMYRKLLETWGDEGRTINGDTEDFIEAEKALSLEEGKRMERERLIGKGELPDKLRETRLHLGLSQEEVGKRLGYSAMAISHFENGSRPIPEKVLGEFVMIFGSLVETRANNRRGKAHTPTPVTSEEV